MNSIRFYSAKKYHLPQLLRRCYSAGLPAVEDAAEVEPAQDVDEFHSGIKLDKSGLLAQHRNMLHGQRPYNQAHSWIHQTEKYQRKLIGKYGSESELDPRICFPQQSVAKKLAKRQKISEPKTLLDMMKQVQEEERQKEEKIKIREEAIGKGMEKLEAWKQELHNKVKKKEADALAAKMKKERLIEEVRRHFGYTVDPRDERFKEVLEQKDREERKKEKQAKREAKENKLISKLSSTTQ